MRTRKNLTQEHTRKSIQSHIIRVTVQLLLKVTSTAVKLIHVIQT